MKKIFAALAFMLRRSRSAYGLKVPLLLLSGLLPVPTLAGIATVDFEDLEPGTYFHNDTSGGFRISPYCHIDVFPFAGREGNAVAFDGCSDTVNPGYIGPEPLPYRSAWLTIDYFEHPFSFVGFGFGFPGCSGATIRSSKGGLLSLPCSGMDWGELTLEGPEWTGIKWIELSEDNAGAPFTRFDDLIFGVPASGVPAPGTFALLGLGIAGLGLSRRRSKPSVLAK